MYNEMCKQIGAVNSNKQENVSVLNSWLQPSEGKWIARGKKKLGEAGRGCLCNPVISIPERDRSIRKEGKITLQA